MNEYDDIIKQGATDDLRSSLYAAGNSKPDDEAALQRLAARTGVPLEAVRLKRPEVEQADRMASFDYEKVIKESPKLSAWLADPKNAALAHDDVANLSGLENTLRTGMALPGAFAGGIVGDVAGRTLSGLGQLYGVGERRLGIQQLPDSVQAPGMMNPGKYLRQSGKMLKDAGDWMKPAAENQNLATDVASGIGQLGGQIAIAIATGGTLSAVMLMAQGSDLMADKTANDTGNGFLTGQLGLNATEARDLAIVGGGAITMITEKYGLSKLLNRVPPEVKNRTLRFIADKVAAGGIEAGQEFAEALLHDIARRTLTNKDGEMLAGVEREMSAAALSAAIVRTALGVKGFRQAQAQDDFVRSLTDQAGASELRKRMPDAFKKYLEQVTAGGPVENVFIPADRFSEFYQSQGLDPAVEASRLGVQNFDEASLAGGDVMIATPDFVTQLSGSDALQGLWNDMRFQQGDMTLREAKEFEESRGDQQIDEETLQRMTGAAPQATGFDAVKEQIMGELVGRFGQSVADDYATQYATVITTLAERSGADPMELANTYNLDVNMPVPDALRRALDRVDIDIDPIIERLRAGDVPTDGAAFGKSLSDFVRDNGGLLEVGEIRGIDQGGRRGQKKIVRKNGFSLDAMLQKAQQAGYFTSDNGEPLTESDLVDALQADVNGDPRYSAMDGDENARRDMEMLGGMAEFLRSIGADVATMTNAEVKALMRLEAAQDVEEVYAQAAFDGPEKGSTPIGDMAEIEVDGVMRSALNSDGQSIHKTQEGVRNFWRWFGESKVVDATGRPVPVYHGTDKKFSKINVGKGAQGLFWFTSDKSAIEAGEVGASGAGVVMQMYAKLDSPADWTQYDKLMLDEFKSRGLDGAILPESDGTFVGFVMRKDQNQIKSATGNSGAFDASNPSILFQSAPATESEAFKTWFGDSKVVDADGKPLVVYHGTTRGGFNEFQGNKRSRTEGFVFTSSKPLALTYSGQDNSAEPGQRNATKNGIYETYLSLQNPKVLEWGGAHFGDNGGTDAAIAAAKAEGHDGVIIRNVNDPGGYAEMMQKRGASPEGIDSVGDLYVVFKPEQIKSATGNNGNFDPASPSILEQNNGDKRGSIKIGANRKMTISLFEKADLSTFLHETGHFYLEVMGDLAAREGAAPGIVEDYQKILSWMGVASRDQIETKHHEMFARANEAYLMEGKAPSVDLQATFQRFKAWLNLIYKTVQQLDITLSADLRGVFDRMYATDQQIEAAQGEVDYAAMFATAADAGMSEAEFQAYLTTVGQTIEQGRERLQTKLMTEYQRERTKKWKEQRETMREQVAAEVDAEPVYLAFRALSTGLTDDGIEVKLSRADLVREFGEPFVVNLPRSRERVYTADGGVDPDTAAEMFDFDSGRSLVEALANMQPRKAMIDQITDQRMVDMFGDIRFDGSIAEEAINALHNDKREDVLKIELRAIRKKAREVAPIIRARDQAERAERQAGEQFVEDALPSRTLQGRTRAGANYSYQAFDPEPMKRAAAGMIGQKQIKDLKPHGYLLAEKNAAKLGAKAMKDGDYMTAAEQKQRELFNHYLYKEAIRVADEVKSKSDWLAEQGGKKRREALGKAGADYLEQVDDILERYEFKQVPLNKLRKRESLSAWVDQQEALGNAVSVPEDVLNEARLVNWRQIPVDELRAVYDSVKNITHLANLKNKLIIKGKQRDFAEVIDELLAAGYAAPLNTTGELSLPNMSGATLGQRIKKGLRGYDAAHMKVEQIISWLDNGDIDGAWARNFFDLAADAQTAEYDLHRKVTTALEQLRRDMPSGWRGALFDKVGFNLPQVTGAGTAVMAKPTRFTILSIALNMGNEQNLQRLRDGNKFTDQQLQQVRDALTEDDMKFVQGTWDAIELLWPDMAALEKRASGIAPEKVEAASFELRGQTYRGGYFPMVYDNRISRAGEKQVESDVSVENFVASGFGRPSTNKGATKKRLEVVNQPLLLDMNDVIGGHIAKVVKDISHREAVMGLHNILMNSEIKVMLIDRLGEAYYRELRNWTQVLVNDRSDTMNAAKGAAKWAMVARTNMAIMVMGWKFSTAFSQFAGFGPSMDLVKPQFLSHALAQATRNPVKTWAMVAEKSGEMRNRVATIDRDVRDAMRRLADKTSYVADVQRTAFIFTAYADRIVSVPTWLGAYNQAISEGLAEDVAVRAGDRAVRLSQGAGGAKDLAAVQRNNELMRLMTMFYTPFSALYARLRDVGHQQSVQGIGYLPKAVARILALVALPAVLGDILAGRGPDEDEDEVWWAMRKMMLYPIAALPGIRDFAAIIDAMIIQTSGEGQVKFPPKFQLSPIVGAIENLAKRAVVKPVAVMNGDAEWDADASWDLFESVGGVGMGLPTAQVRVTGEYLQRLMTGDEQPENAPEVVKGLLFRQKPPPK